MQCIHASENQGGNRGKISPKPALTRVDPQLKRKFIRLAQSKIADVQVCLASQGSKLFFKTRMVDRVQYTPAPARQIPLSRRSHIIGFQPLATGIAQHESSLERDFVTLTSFVHPCAIIHSQPVTIGFMDGAVRRRYTPDFLVRLSNEPRAELIEVKYEQDLRENWAHLRAAFEAADRWAHENQATFRVVTECDIRGPLLNNAKRLLPLRAAPLDLKMTLLALTATHALARPTFGSVLSSLPDRAVGLATVWRLIARGVLRADLSQPITFDSELRAI